MPDAGEGLVVEIVIGRSAAEQGAKLLAQLKIKAAYRCDDPPTVAGQRQHVL